MNSDVPTDDQWIALLNDPDSINDNPDLLATDRIAECSSKAVFDTMVNVSGISRPDTSGCLETVWNYVSDCVESNLREQDQENDLTPESAVDLQVYRAERIMLVLQDLGVEYVPVESLTELKVAIDLYKDTDSAVCYGIYSDDPYELHAMLEFSERYDQLAALEAKKMDVTSKIEGTNRICGNCSRYLAKHKRKRCSGCHCTWYCNRDCQVKHWNCHKKWCHQIAKILINDKE